MFSSAEKTKNVTMQRQQQPAGQTFFRKAGEESFYGSKESPSFFAPTVQAKLSVSSPDDPQEKEADAMADTVMRMPEPVAATTQNDEEKKVQRKEEGQEEPIQAKFIAPVINLQQKCEPCEKEGKAQAKFFRMVQRSEDVVGVTNEEPEKEQTIQPKHLSLYHSDVLRQSGRGPPVGSIQPSFEQNLSSSKGDGSPLPESPRQFMESRFNADFSGVRIHTGSHAENLSSNINAQAFTHGNDIYFNSGKYSPNTETGGTLLAHELTHTVQQGASTSYNPATKTSTAVAPKNILLHRQTTNIHNIGATANGQLHRSIIDENVLSQVDFSAKAGGHKLSEGAKEYLQDYYKTDLSDIRIHTDNDVATLCKAAGVNAFVKDKDIGIIPSRYDPDSEQGAVLLSEQVSKSLQQRGIRPTAADGNDIGGPASLVSRILAAVKENKAKEENPVQGNKAPSTASKLLTEKTKKQPGKEGKKIPDKKLGGKKQPGKRKAKDNGGIVIKSSKRDPEKSPSTPAEDPAFQKVVKKTKATAKNQKQHEPAEKKSVEAQNNAEAVPKEAESKAQNRKTDGMGEATKEDKPFDAASFKADLLKKIESITPKTLEEATEFKENNKIDGVKTAMGEKVAGEKQNTTGPVNNATQQSLQVNEADNKQPVPLPPTLKGAAPAGVGARDAAPKNKLNGEITMQEQSQPLDEEMKANNVSEGQLTSSNEPTFTAALDEKNNAQKDAVEKPQQYRKEESLAIKEAKADATEQSAQSLAGMHGARGKNFDATVKHQQSAKQKDEERRALVAKSIEDKYKLAEQKVTTALEAADTEANLIFDQGSEAARVSFENYVTIKMGEYKRRRYSGFWGGLRWAKDKLFGMPDAVNVFYTDGRELYLKKMDEVITQVSNAVTTKLNEAKQAITDGKKEIDDYVSQLPKDLQDVGKEAAESIQDKFDSLEQSVNDKRDGLIDGLAKKYVDNVKKLDERIGELKEANKGLIDKAIGFLKKVWQVIKDLTNLFMTILARLASIIGTILSSPSGFFDNLGKAFKMGFDNFKSKFTEYLEKGLMEWLATNLGIKGIELPEKFDASAIFSLALQVMGITKVHIRERAVALLGERKVALLEKGGGLIYRVYNEGLGVIWEMIVEKLTDFKELVWDAIKSFIQKSIIEAALIFLISLLNPIGAFIKVCMAIYDFLMMLVRFKDRIIELLDTILSAVTNIASGAVDAAASMIEKALAKSISIIIGFLAALLHLNNIFSKIREIITRIQKRVEKALDWVILKAYSLVGKLVEGAMNIQDKGAAMVEKGKQAVVGAGKKVLGWLGFKKNFKDDKGGDHEIYFEGSESSAKLYVASYNPKTIPTLLAAVAKLIDKPKNKSHAQKYQDAVKLNGEIEMIKGRLANKSNPNADKDNEEMNKKLDQLATKLPPLMTMVGGTEPPPLLKPGFANGVKAGSFEVFYLKSGRTSGGSGANTYSGATLAGWPKINQTGLSAKSAWVKMHLLTEQLGGPALDSNLTPARGPETNSAFYREVEKHSIDAVENDQVIWFKTLISYHGAPDNDYPNFISMEWGPYQFNDDNEQWEKKAKGTVIDGTKIGGFYDQNPAAPDFSGATVTPNLNDPSVGRVKIENLATGITRPFAEFVQQVRSDATFKNEHTMEKRLRDAYRQRTIPIDNFEAQVASLKSQVNITYTIQKI